MEPSLDKGRGLVEAARETGGRTLDIGVRGVEGGVDTEMGDF